MKTTLASVPTRSASHPKLVSVTLLNHHLVYYADTIRAEFLATVTVGHVAMVMRGLILHPPPPPFQIYNHVLLACPFESLPH